MKIPKKILMATGGSALLLASSMITHFEGVKFKPYFDGGGILSVCYGHTGKDIERNKTYSKSECEDLLDDDLKAVKHHVDQLIKVNISTLTQASLYSFAYNVGIGNFAKSTLLKKLNANDRKGACDEIKRWVYIGGEKWKGLMTRREIESAICQGDLTHLS